MERTKDRVTKLLTERPDLRDCKDLTLVAIWREDLNQMAIDPSQVSAEKFLLNLAFGNLTNQEAVGRMWRLVQERNPALRGEKWLHRHNNLEPKVRDKIKGMTP